MQISSRIKQRHDTQSNWETNNIVLLNGELAVVDCGNQIRFKIGNGISSFNQLKYVDQNQLCTDWLTARAISQGTYAKSVPFGLAAGAFLCANANYSQALGYNAQTLSSDLYSFVWNGDTRKNVNHYYNPLCAEDYYNSHGVGSFNINPLSGLSGFYIGEQNLADLIDGSGSKIFIDDRISGISGKNDLSVVKLSANEYAQMFIDGQLLSNCIYVVEDDIVNVCGQQIKNLAAGTDFSDAVTLEQLQSISSQIPLSVGQLINDAGYLSAHQSLSNYYTKSDTSSAVEISDELLLKANISSLTAYEQISSLPNDVSSIVLSSVDEWVITNETEWSLVSEPIFYPEDGWWEAEFSNGNDTVHEIDWYSGAGATQLHFEDEDHNLDVYVEKKHKNVLSVVTYDYLANQLNVLTSYEQKSSLQSDVSSIVLSSVPYDISFVSEFGTLVDAGTAPEYDYNFSGEIGTNHFFIYHFIGGNVNYWGWEWGADYGGNISDFDINTDQMVTVNIANTPLATELGVDSITFTKTQVVKNALGLVTYDYLSSELSTTLNDYYQKSETSSAAEISNAFENNSNVFFDDRISSISGKNDLSVIKLSADEYAQMLEDGACVSNAIYIVEAPVLDAFRQRVTNVAPAVDLSDAVNLEQLSNAVNNIQVPTDLSDFTNSPGYLTKASADVDFQPKGDYLTSVPTTYKTYTDTKATLSTDGYLLTNDVTISYSNKIIWLSSKAYVTSVDCTDFIKDGMLSSAELCGTTLILNFNTDAGSDPISVELSNFVDDYDGKITYLSDCISANSEAISAIPTDLSGFTNGKLFVTSAEISDDLAKIDTKIFVEDCISGISGYNDLSVIKLSSDEYASLLTANSILSNCIYIVEDQYENAYGRQIKNVAFPTDLSDAATKGYVDNAISGINIPIDLSSFINSPGYVTNDELSVQLSSKADKQIEQTSIQTYQLPSYWNDEYYSSTLFFNEISDNIIQWNDDGSLPQLSYNVQTNELIYNSIEGYEFSIGAYTPEEIQQYVQNNIPIEYYDEEHDIYLSLYPASLTDYAINVTVTKDVVYAESGEAGILAQIATKQNALNGAQMSAVNSGITSEKVATYDALLSSQVELAEETTYATLRAKRDTSALETGKLYRITDYVTTTTQTDTSAAGHQFDIIVKAISPNQLDNVARAAIHAGDTYFNVSSYIDLSKWELRYTLDNDTNRFAWADSTNGKGVIYWMKDDYDNEAPYDFKNILFRSAQWFDSNDTSFYYTFNFKRTTGIVDNSCGFDRITVSTGNSTKVYGNIIKPRYENNSNRKQLLNFITLNSNFNFQNVFEFGCYEIFGYQGTVNNNYFSSNSFKIYFYGSAINNYFSKYCNRIYSGYYLVGNYFAPENINLWLGSSQSISNLKSYWRYNNFMGAIGLVLDVTDTTSTSTQIQYVTFEKGFGSNSANSPITLQLSGVATTSAQIHPIKVKPTNEETIII